MTQTAAFQLNIEGSSKTVEAFQAVNKLIRDNTQSMKEFQKSGDLAATSLAKLTKENQKLKTQSEATKKELQDVDAKMKTLLATNKQASNEYKNLKARKAELVQQDIQLTKAIEKNDTAIVKNTNSLKDAKQKIVDYTLQNEKLKVELNSLRKTMREQAKEFVQMNDNIPKDSIIGMGREISKLTKQWELMTAAERNSAQGKELQQHLFATKQKFDELNRSVGNFKSSIGDYRGALNEAGKGFLTFGKQALGAFGISSGVAVGVATFKEAVKTVFDFEQGLDKLSSLTGVIGNDLKVLGNKSIEISGEFGTSANEILRAFTLVGSASPKLLKDIAGLSEVARNANILQVASGDSLEDSVKAVTLTMAQFNIEADQSSLIVDTLATASQKGATEIPQITEALEGVGNTAHIVGQTFDETIAAIEAFGAAGLKGTDVGVKYRNILISLAKSGRSEFNPAIHSLADVLDNLSGEITTVEQAVGLFKRENADAALALINHRDVVRDLTGNLNDFGNAQRQAIINTENGRGNITKLTTAWENLILTVEKGEGAFGRVTGSMINNITKLLNSMRTTDITDFTDAIIHLTTLPLNVIDVITGKDAKDKQAAIDAKIKAAKDAVEFAKNYETVIENGIPVLKKRESAEQTLFEQQNRGWKARQDIIKEEMRLNDLHNLSIDALQERRIQLYAQPIVNPEDNDRIRQQIQEIDALIKEKTGRGGSTTKTIIEFGENTIGGLGKQIKDLNDVLQNTTDETVITQTTKQIIELEKRVADIQSKIDAVKLAESKAFKAGFVSPSFASGALDISGEAPPVDPNAKTQEQIDNEKAAALADVLFFQQTEAGKALFAAEVNQKRLENNEETNKKLAEQNEVAAALQLQKQQQFAVDMVGLFTDLGISLSGFFDNQEEDQNERNKKRLETYLSFLEKFALLAVAQATGVEVGTKGILGLPTAAIAAGVIKLAFAGLRGLINSYEEGGEVTAGVPYRRAGTSDNVLIHAKKGEVILNEKHQKNLKRVAGEGIFGRIGVKGFANTAMNNIVMNQSNSGISSIDGHSIELLAARLSQSIPDAIINKNREVERKRLAGIY